MGKVLTVNIGHLEELQLGEKVAQSGIRKRPTEGARRLADHAVEGDHIGNPLSHGGPFKAVYAYAREDLDFWEAQLGRDITNGMFGENLTLTGIDVTNALVGETWQIGTAVVKVVDVRTPCWKWGIVMEDQTLLRTFREAHRPGAYLSILQEGEVASGDSAVVMTRPSHDVSCSTISQALLGDEDARRRLTQLDDLAPARREWARAHS